MAADNSLEKKVAQLLMVGLPGATLDNHQLKLLSRTGIGGVILFKRNYQNLAQLVELTNSVQKAVTADSWQGLPAWVAADHEGGRVQRFSAPFTQFPPAKMWGDLQSPKTCFEAGYVMGKELRACGVNINFAPVADVPASLSNQEAIGDRAFSSDPEVVANMSSATSRGLQKGGVLSVIKHFPGHGAVELDSHQDLPHCAKTLEELEAKEWVPFRRAIRSRAEGVMTAHILYPKLDADRPATLSRKILQEQLRKNLRHAKLIFSDDLEMGAIQKKYSLNDAAFLAIEAGCDQILICQDWDQIEGVWQYLVKAFESGALPPNRLDESLERIADAKRRYLLPFSYASEDLARAVVGAPEFLAVAEAIRQKQTVESGPSTKDQS